MLKSKKIVSVILAITMILTLMYVQPQNVKAANVYYIRTIADLYSINNDMSGTYYLMNDIDMYSDTATNGGWSYNGNGWEPIGSEGIYSSTAFTGTFYGNNHTISGMRISYSTGYLGLFANNEGTIRDLNMKSVYINSKVTGSKYSQVICGAIAATNSGTIINCSSSGNIYASKNVTIDTASSRVGGIVGENEGRLLLCNNSAYVEASYSTSIHAGKTTFYANIPTVNLAGGIAGENSCGTIDQCYNIGTVKAPFTEEKYSSDERNTTTYSAYSGGITGVLVSGKITNCYNCGKSAWGIAAKIYSKISNIENCYNSVSGGGIAPSVDGVITNCYSLNYNSGKSLTEEQMKIQSMYSGFDFTNIWIIDSNTEYKYPQLRSNRQTTLKEIQTIEIYTLPDKLTCYVGEKPNLEGGSIIVYYIDGSSEVLKMTDDMLSRTTTLVGPGTQKYDIKYRNVTITNAFSVVYETKPDLIGINLLSKPTKTEFVYKTEFDFSGCQVQLAYDNGTVETIDVTPEMTTGGDINKIGIQTIKYTNGSKSVTFYIEVIPIQTERIEIVSKPNTVNYIEGQSFSKTGLSVKAYYNNGTSAIIEDYEISGYENTVGTHTITVTYSGVSATFDVYVREARVTSIEVTSNPKKTQYIQGQSVDTTGMVVKAYYDNGTSKVITDYTVDELGETTGFQTVAVNYGELKAYITVTVIARQVEGIAIKQLPNQINYIEETEFDSTGLVVTATFNDGITEEVTDYSISEVSTKEVGEKTVTILYGGKSATFNINVVAKTLDSITVEMPDNLSFFAGEEFDTTAIVVTAHYNNKKSEVISDYTVSGYTGEVGSNAITIEFGGKTINFYVKVHKPEEEWHIIKEPDCENKGERVKYCTECGDVVLTEEISELGHTEVIDKAVLATCTETGLTEGAHCSVCEKVLVEQTVVEAKGHTPSEEWSIISNPLCVDTGLQIRTCTECGETIERKIIDAKGHNIVIDDAVAPTCTTSGLTEGSHCDVCNEIFVAQKVVEATGHTPSTEWTVTKEATCSKAGERVKYCTVCNEIVEKEIIEALGHSYKKYISDNNATCTEDGTKTAKCERCESTNTVSDEGSSLGHHIILDKSVLATCTESGLSEGSHCDVCGEIIKKQQVVEPKGHNASTIWSCELEATCTEKGQEVIRCIECDEVLDTRKTEAIGHSFKKYTSDNNATCIEDGTKTAKCERCEVTNTVIDECSAKGHSEVIDKAVSATCTKTGLTEGSHCDVCETIIKEQKTVNTLEHVIVTKNVIAATYFNSGYTGDEVCDCCGKVYKKGQSISKYVLEKPSVKLKTKKGKLTVKVKKVKGAQYFEYKIKIGKKWKKYVTTKTVYTFNKLKKGKKYSVKVRAYVVSNGVKAYSKWSKIKKKKIIK